MDLTKRKHQFIERFMQIVNPEKIKRLEDFLQAELTDEQDAVAYTIAGEPLNADQYKKRVHDADEAIDHCEFISHEDLKDKVATWGK